MYSNKRGIVNLPTKHKPFIEVVMRMLDQSGHLDEEELETAHGALRNRLGIEESTVGRTEPDLGDAQSSLITAFSFAKDEDLEEIQADIEDILGKLQEYEEEYYDYR